MKFPKENTIDQWLDKHKNPEIDRFIEKNLEITENVQKALDARGWSQADFAKAMDKRPSEVSKWLSGMHNLTLKSIIKMEAVLGIDIIHTEPKREFEYVFLGVVENQKDMADQAVEYQESQYALAM